ncbi:MAG TPA: hypothetical protein VHJ38_00210 [Nitrososphaeraceae archaeon]|nr:hypothetical protein [Nitrososphaeraceae archaeon]
MINSSNSSKASTDKKINVVVDDDHPLRILKKKDPSFQLSFLPSSSSSSSQSQSQFKLPSPLSPPILKIAIWKDTRLEQLDISQDLIEILHINGFTIERILEYGQLKIAKILGIDESYAQIIFNEATKRIN